MEKGKQNSESDSKKEENEWLEWWKQLKEDHNKKKIEFLYPMARDKKAYEELSKKLCSLHKPIYDVVSIFDVHQLLLNLGIVMSITDINEQFVKMHRPSEFHQYLEENMPEVLERAKQNSSVDMFFDPTKKK